MAPTMSKAKIIPKTGRDRSEINVLFNPAEYTLEKSNQFQSTALPGLGLPVHQFVSGQADTLTMDLFFDTFTDGGGSDVTAETGRLAKLLEIDAELHAPPIVMFAWSSLRFTAIIERLSQRFTMFAQDGTPVRATVSVTFKEYKTVREQLNEISRRSTDRYKRRVVIAGLTDQLWRLAAREYDDPAQWRVIAERNRIDEPLDLEPGRALLLEPLE
jgi:hypothetical protein